MFSATAIDPFPLAPLLLLEERHSIERCRAESGMSRTPMSNVALVGVVAAELA
jgi:hypothetical protein